MVLRVGAWAHLMELIDKRSLGTSLFGEGLLEFCHEGFALAEHGVEVGWRVEGDGAFPEIEFLAVAMEEEQKAAGGAWGHHALGHRSHEVLDEVGEDFGVRVHDPGTQLTPFAVWAEGDVLVGACAGPGGVADVEGFRGVVAATILTAVGGAMAALAVRENEGAETKHGEPPEMKKAAKRAAFRWDTVFLQFQDNFLRGWGARRIGGGDGTEVLEGRGDRH